MKKSELNDFDFIKNKFEEAAPTVPQKLTEESIKQLITSGKEHKVIKFQPKRNFKPFVAAAACVALVIGLMAAVYPLLNKAPVTQGPTPNTVQSKVSTFKDTQELNSFVQSLIGCSSERGCAGINEAYDMNGNDKMIVAEKKKAVGDYVYESVYDYKETSDRFSSINIYKKSNGKKQLVHTINDFGVEYDSIIVYQNKLILNSVTNDYVEGYGICNYKTNIRIYDIVNPENPTFISEYTQSGSYRKMYIANETLYLVTDFCVSDYDTDQSPRSGLNGEYALVKPENIARFEHITQREFLVVSALNPQTGESVKETVAVIGAHYNVYCNENYIYFQDTNYMSYDEDESNDNNTRNFIKLSITGDKMEFTAKGKIEGVKYDDCGINEKGGYVYVLALEKSAEYKIINEPEYNKELISKGISRIYVLDSDLNIVGKSDDIVNEYNIEKIGFDKDKAYITLYGEMGTLLDEPSIIIDFSNPIAPVINEIEK